MKLRVFPTPPSEEKSTPVPSHSAQTAGGGFLSRPRVRAFGGGGGRGKRPVRSLSWRKLRPTRTPLDHCGGTVEAHFISLVLREQKKKKSLNQKGKRASASSPSRQRRVSFWQESEQNQNKTKDQIKWWFSIDVNIDIAQGTAGTQRPDTSVDIGRESKIFGKLVITPVPLGWIDCASSSFSNSGWRHTVHTRLMVPVSSPSPSPRPETWVLVSHYPLNHKAYLQPSFLV